jgi:hypothetical protein
MEICVSLVSGNGKITSHLFLVQVPTLLYALLYCFYCLLRSISVLLKLFKLMKLLQTLPGCSPYRGRDSIRWFGCISSQVELVGGFGDTVRSTFQRLSVLYLPQEVLLLWGLGKGLVLADVLELGAGQMEDSPPISPHTP